MEKPNLESKAKQEERLTGDNVLVQRSNKGKYESDFLITNKENKRMFIVSRETQPPVLYNGTNKEGVRELSSEETQIKEGSQRNPTTINEKEGDIIAGERRQEPSPRDTVSCKDESLKEESEDLNGNSDAKKVRSK